MRVSTVQAILALLILGIGWAQAGDRQSLQTLSGTYADPAPYSYGEGVWGRRIFTFDSGTWSLDFTLSLDPAGKVGVFRFRTLGDYKVLGPSAPVPGAYEAVFGEDAKFVTLLTPDPGLAAAFGLDTCDLTPNVEADISETGCALWKPVAICAEDHDLLALTATGGIRFGQRPRDNDMCTADKRPTALTPAVIRQ